jgi:hypothetical protein
MFRNMRFSIVLVLIMLVSAVGVAAQGPGTEVGVGVPGQNGIELIGQIDQLLFTLTAYGYVTHIDGIPDELLFAEGTNPLMRDAANARFTFYGLGNSVGRAIHENIFASPVEASLQIYYNETPIGATFDTPDSFVGGDPIASLSERLFSVLNVQEPNIGVLMIQGDSTQDTATPFSLGGDTYTLGYEGLTQHFTSFGQGFRSSTDPLTAKFNFAGVGTSTSGSQGM